MIKNISAHILTRFKVAIQAHSVISGALISSLICLQQTHPVNKKRKDVPAPSVCGAAISPLGELTQSELN